MKSKRTFHPFLCSFAVFSVFVLITAAMIISLFYYLFSIPKPAGLSLASWPQMFTDSFSVWMDYKDGTVEVEKIGLDRLDKYGLWIQILDESGQEVFSYNKPENYPTSYPASALLMLGTSAYEHENTVFVSCLEDAKGSCSYIIGFPYAIGKYMLYYDGEKVARLLPVAEKIVLAALAVLAALVFGYIFWISNKLASITGAIRNVSLRTYLPLKEKGMFSDIYAALNKMDVEIKQSDKIKEETERARKDWIANITHDLKTPLSPIKGYAELLADNQIAGMETAQEYGKIMLKNVSHVEKLLNDLKLTYQIDSGEVPCHPREVLISRYLREIIIDIINDPVFSSRNIEFEGDRQELIVCLDPYLFRRAVQNIIINALIHNLPDTKIKISIGKSAADIVFISICDNGDGMDEAEQAKLFNRYYRGTNTREKPEGSGLGLAIAKQIVELHGGKLSVKSSPGIGTEFIITLDASNLRSN